MIYVLLGALVFAALCLALTRKQCPNCFKHTHYQAPECGACGYRWPEKEASAGRRAAGIDCQECGEIAPRGELSRAHSRECSLHPDNLV